jgi:hypothetical protein
MREGVAGLLRDKTRPSRIPPLAQAAIDRVIELTASEPPHEATHWTASTMAEATGTSPSSVLRIWRAHRLRPHRVRAFKLSKDPAFAAKLRDLVGLYLDPPAHAIVLSADEKPQIQALDRTQPGLPVTKGRCATMTQTASATARPRCSQPSTSWTGRCWAAACSGTATRSSCAS